MCVGGGGGGGSWRMVRVVDGCLLNYKSCVPVFVHMYAGGQAASV